MVRGLHALVMAAVLAGAPRAHAAAPALRLSAEGPVQENPPLDVSLNGWGEAIPANVERLLLDVGRTFPLGARRTLRHRISVVHCSHQGDCARPRLGFSHGRLVITLTAQHKYWAFISWEFARQFCHAITISRALSESRDPEAFWKGYAQRENAHFDDALCEAVAWHALLQMGANWKTNPPYPNWASYSQSLTTYARDRMRPLQARFAASGSGAAWLATHPDGFRDTAQQGDEEHLVAAVTLRPCLEAELQAWEALSFLNTGSRPAKQPILQEITAWRDRTPARARALVQRILTSFGAP